MMSHIYFNNDLVMKPFLTSLRSTHYAGGRSRVREEQDEDQ